MSLRREQEADLERIFYDFMEYYKYKNKNYYWYTPPYPNYPPMDCHKHKDMDCKKHKHIHDKMHPEKPPYNMPFTTLPYYFITPFRADEYTLDPRATKVLTPATVCNENETFPTIFAPNPEAYEMMDMEMRVDYDQTEASYYKALFTDLNTTLMPYVEQVVKSNNYVGSPINDKYFDRETLAQLVTEVLTKAKENPKLVDYVMDLDPKVRELMRNIIQALLLGELFVVYRPNTELSDKNVTSMPYEGESPRISKSNTRFNQGCGCLEKYPSNKEKTVRTKTTYSANSQENQYFSN